MKKTLGILMATAMLVPASAFAFITFESLVPERVSLFNLASLVLIITNILLPTVMVLLVVAFFYGLSKYVFSAGDPKKAEEGKSIMIYGILAMFVGLSIWGIVSYLSNFLDLPYNSLQSTINIPNINIPDLGDSQTI